MKSRNCLLDFIDRTDSRCKLLRLVKLLQPFFLKELIVHLNFVFRLHVIHF